MPWTEARRGLGRPSAKEQAKRKRRQKTGGSGKRAQRDDDKRRAVLEPRPKAQEGNDKRIPQAEAKTKAKAWVPDPRAPHTPAVERVKGREGKEDVPFSWCP